MAATRYMVMFRYINPATNTPITNDMSNEYKEEYHLIHTGHPHRAGDADWEAKITDVILFGNDSQNPKYDMLFVYNGTKRIPRYTNYPIYGSPSNPITGCNQGYPYTVVDKYVRVTMSPWFSSSIYGSFEAALEKARTLADMIGLNNVKLIKMVPFDQKLKVV